MREQAAGLDADEARARRTRRRRQRTPSFRTKTARGGLLNLCVVQGGKITVTAIVPANEAQAFRATHPGARACPPPRRAGAPPINVNALLDASTDGTFSDARRNALLAHVNPDATADAIRGLVRAADRGTIGDQFAGERIAAIAAPPVAAAQAGEAVPVLTREQLAEQRRQRAAGLSDSEVLAKQIAKLNEACLPGVCFMAGRGPDGKPTSINFVTITPEEAARTPGFVRFCNRDDLAAAGHAEGSWGTFFGDKVREAGAALGLVAPAGPRVLTVALPNGLPPPPGPTPSFAPTINPGGMYLMLIPGGGSAIVPGHEVPLRLSQGWTLA